MIKRVICVVGALIGVRLVTVLTGFKYNVFSDPFNAGKFAIDLGVFVAFYLLIAWGMRVLPRRSRSNQGV